MKISQVAAQLYTLRDFIKTPADIAATLRKVRQIGYKAVQVSGMGPIAEEELVRLLDGEGLICCATHEDSTRILNETERIVERLRKLNCRFTAYPYPRDVDCGSRQAVFELAAKLDAAGQCLRRAGQVLTYHNHALELQRFDGRTALEWIYEKTGAGNIQGEIDTYWIQYGGQDSAAWCRKLSGRLPLIHLKDYLPRGGKPAFAPVGHGNLDMPGIIRAAEVSGCRWFIVEQDDCYGEDPFEAMAQSYRYLESIAGG